MLDLAVTFCSDLGIEAEELVARGDVTDGAVEAEIVVVVDAGVDGGAFSGLTWARIPA